MSRTIGNIEKLTNEGQTQQQQQQQQQHEKSHDMSSVMKDCAKNTYMDEVSIIDNMASFLEANGCANIDQSILRNMAEALAKNINDTNPGILQDATMDNTYGVGYRSPCVSLQQYHGSTSPAVQGRSVREFEEHTAALRKENFNLKLRLYFIEENIPALKSNGADGCDTAMRELIEHKVEVEMLRRELEEKKAVLKDALQAIEDMEKFQKETETSYEAKMDDLKQKIQFLEVDRNVDKSESSDFMNNVLSRPDIVSEHVNNIKRIRELETLNKSYEDTISELENKVTFLDGILAKRDHTIKEFEDKIKSLEYRNAELQEELDEKKQDNASNEKLREELREQRIELADKVCMLDELEGKIAKLEQTKEQAGRTILALTETVKDQQLTIDRLKSGDDGEQLNSSNSVLSPVNEKEITSKNFDFNTDCTAALNRSLSDMDANKSGGSQKRDLETKIKLQESIIKNLRTEVKKKTADLQNLINNELWGKNREIERLTKCLNDRNPNSAASPTTTSNKTPTKCELLHPFNNEIEYAKAVENNRQLQLKIDILVQRLGAERENEKMVSKLRREVREARTDAENSERFRRECADLCSVLTERLEELAGFLNSLLKHKDVLGFLAADSRRAIRKAVDRSLDLSKSLNRTLSLSGVPMIEHSLAQLCNLSEILGNDSNISIDLAETTNAIAIGAEGSENKTFNSHEEACAIETLKAENKALKKELDKRRTIEIKKDRRSLPANAIAAALENQSESEAWSEPDRKVSLARIGLEDHSASKDISATQTGHPDTDSESDIDPAGDALNHSRLVKMRSQQQEAISQLEQLIGQRDERILQIQCQLVEADNRLKKENLRVIDLTQEVKELRERNDQLYTDLMAIGVVGPEQNQSSSDESIWLRQIEEQAQLLETIQDERDRLAIEARVATQQIGELKESLEKMRSQHESAMRNASEQERQHLKELRNKMEIQMKQQMEEQQKLHAETLEQLTELQRQYVEAQRSIDSHIENAKELRQTLVESELNARGLKKQLDESALQASKAIVERSKVMSDKLQVEQELEEYKKQLNEAQRRIVELEAQLQKATAAAAAAAAQSPDKSSECKENKLNGSDCSQSGYTSEEVAPLLRRTAPAARNSENTKNVQRLNNSSPDLGIESDAGRVSSVELTNMHRSLLMKIEFPDKGKGGDIKNEAPNCDDDDKDNKGAFNDSDKLDTENRPPTTNANGIQHDCAKVDQENVDLRRKLARTKRALEDTYQKLRNSNQMKAQIERDIRNQIIKTHNVLKNVRSNMEHEK